MDMIIADLNLSEEITAALQRKPGKLTSIIETVIAYEQAEWDKYDVCLQALGTTGEDVESIYIQAVAWSEEVIRQ